MHILNISLEQQANIEFELDEKLLYKINKNRRRLVILISIEQEMFRLAHDETQHSSIYRYYAHIVDILYISRLFKKLRQYVEHCLLCQTTQIKRHKSYDELTSIKLSSRSFHTLIMNFIVVLLDELDIILSIICKFSRRIILILDKSIYNASQ